MLALFHVTHMRNYWNTNDHPRTHQLWWWPRGVWWGLRRQETCWRGRRRWSDSSPQLSDSSHIWTNSFENQILLHVSLFFTLTLTSPGLSLWSPAGQSQVRFPAGERLQSSSTYIESVKVVKSCNCHRHQIFVRIYPQLVTLMFRLVTTMFWLYHNAWAGDTETITKTPIET